MVRGRIIIIIINVSELCRLDRAAIKHTITVQPSSVFIIQ